MTASTASTLPAVNNQVYTNSLDSVPLSINGIMDKIALGLQLTPKEQKELD